MPDLPPPTRARYVVLAFLAALVFVLYLDRVCIARAALSMEDELGLSHAQMGYIFGAFTIAYGLFEVPTGRWGDRFGSRGVLTRIVLWWSVFTALTGCVAKFSWDSGRSIEFALGSFSRDIPLAFNTFVLLVILRFLFGAGEAGALPNVARVVERWASPHERGIAQGVILTAMQIGGAAAPVFTDELIQHIGWRLSFAFYGCLGVIWGVLFYRWYRDDPAEHPAVNQTERMLLARSQKDAPQGDSHPPIPWRMVLSSANVWLLGLIMTSSAFASYMYMFWLPTYFKEAHNVNEETAARLQALVLVGAAGGSFCGGYLSTRVVRWTGENRWSRRLLGFAMLASAAALLGASVLCASPLQTGLVVATAAFFGHAHIGNWWAATFEISGRHLGALFGLVNSLGVPGAFGSPIFMGEFADYRKGLGFTGRERWDPAFFVYAGVLLLGAICWLLVDATKSATESDG